MVIAGGCGKEFVTSDVQNANLSDAHSICVDPLNPHGWWIGGESTVRYCDGKSVSLVAGIECVRGDADGVGGEARFSLVNDMVSTRDRKWLYVSDYANHKIKVIELATRTRRVSTTPVASPIVVDGKCREDLFFFPTRVSLERSSSSAADEGEPALWIAATRLFRLDFKTGAVIWLPLKLGVESVDFMPNRTLIVVHQQTLYSVDPRTREVTRLVDDNERSGTGNSQFSFLAPLCLIVDSAQCAYIFDRSENRIHHFTLPPALLQT